MAKTPETIAEWIKHYEALSKKASDNYQSTGEPKYDRACAKYDVIIDGLYALEREKKEREVDIKKRIHNCNGVIDRLKRDEPFSRDEVVALLKEAVWW